MRTLKVVNLLGSFFQKNYPFSTNNWWNCTKISGLNLWTVGNTLKILKILRRGRYEITPVVAKIMTWKQVCFTKNPPYEILKKIHKIHTLIPSSLWKTFERSNYQNLVKNQKNWKNRKKTLFFYIFSLFSIFRY